MKKYLEFMQVDNPKKKTKLFHVFNKNTSEFLCEIRWDCGWRQYVTNTFTDFKDEKIAFTAGCHREVADFIDGLMEERKVNKALDGAFKSTSVQEASP